MRRCVPLVVWFFVACGPPPAVKPEPISFSRSIRPLFSRCTPCHYAGNLSGLDLQRPFSDTEGLINRASVWTAAQHTLLVVPGKPEESQLMNKIDPALPLDPHLDGRPMPITIDPVTSAELADIRQWITSGATDDAFYRSNVATIFGNAANLGRSIGKCSYCHTATSPNAPDVVNAFGPRGLVNVSSSFGGKRVVPGDPDNSTLVKKLAETVPASLGRKMPLNDPALTAEELELVRRWISEGALDN